MYVANSSRRFYFAQSNSAIVRLAPRAVSLVKRQDETAVNAAFAGPLAPAIDSGDLAIVTAPASVVDLPTFEDDGPDGWLELIVGGLV